MYIHIYIHMNIHEYIYLYICINVYKYIYAQESNVHIYA